MAHQICTYIWNGLFANIATIGTTRAHQHPVIQLSFALDRPFSMKFGDEPWQEYTSIAIASNVLHDFDGHGGTTFNMFIDPESSDALRLNRKFLHKKIMASLDSPGIEKYLIALQHLWAIKAACDEARQAVDALIQHMSPSAQHRVHMDNRVEQAKQYIKANIHASLSAKEIADSVFISESRLMHLFSEHVGLPIRKYILWLRLQMAVKEILQGETMTRAALFAGFADSAHFSRTYAEMFGLTPSDTYKNPENYTIIDCL